MRKVLLLTVFIMLGVFLISGCIEEQPGTTCYDGTAYGQCSNTKPKYCENGTLVDRCSICGCPEGKTCENNQCVTIGVGDGEENLSVAIFVGTIESETGEIYIYDQLKSEIDRYVEDIKRDLGVSVHVYNRTWQNADDVKNKLVELYQSEGLVGAVLIGDIPTAYFEGSTGNDVPTDHYYMDLNDSAFVDTNGNGKFEIEEYTSTEATMEEIWVGRITPPIDSTEGIALIKDYFDRNHRYRTGQISVPKKMLFFDAIMIFDEQLTSGEYDERAEDVINKILLYDKSDATILYNLDSQQAFNEYLNALGNNEYELVLVSMHGTDLQHGNLNYEDIRDISPKGYFYFLSSCSNGRFINENYVAGHFLFNGNGLVVYAATVPIMASYDSQVMYVYPMSVGATFGETFKYSGHLSVAQQLLGDPTLTVRSKPITAPKLEANTTLVDFGDVVVVEPQPGQIGGGGFSASISIKNIGNAEGSINPRFGMLTTKEGDEGIGGVEYRDQIPVGESVEVIFYFNPTVKGEYTGLYVIYTNDPDNPFMEIHLKGVGV